MVYGRPLTCMNIIYIIINECRCRSAGGSRASARPAGRTAPSPGCPAASPPPAPGCPARSPRKRRSGPPHGRFPPSGRYIPSRLYPAAPPHSGTPPGPSRSPRSLRPAGNPPARTCWTRRCRSYARVCRDNP